MPIVQSGSSSNIADDTPPDSSWRGEGGAPPPTPQGGPDLQGLLPKTPVADLMPGSRVPGWGVDSDQPPVSLRTPPRAGYNCDPGGG